LLHEIRAAAKSSIRGYNISGFLCSRYKESHAKSDIYNGRGKTTFSFINQLHLTPHPQPAYVFSPQ